MFAQPNDHLRAELRRIDLLLHREILRLRARYQLSLDEFRGLYISDEQVDRVIDHSLRSAADTEPAADPVVADLTRQADALRVDNAAALPADFPAARIAREFGLTAFEQDTLLLASAAELDLKYETLFAYLNNDVTRKWPTIDLALRLFAATEALRVSLRVHLAADAPLFRSGLLRAPAPSENGRLSWLAGPLAPSAGVVCFLLGQPFDDAATSDITLLIDPSAADVARPLELKEDLRRLPRLFEAPDPSAPMLVFEGVAGSGRFTAAAAVCRLLGLSVLRIDGRAMRAAADPRGLLARLALRLRLTSEAAYFADAGAMLESDTAVPMLALQRWAEQVAGRGRPVFLAIEPGTTGREWLHRQPHLVFRFDDPAYESRVALWEDSLSRRGVSVAADDIETLATRFVLNPGQIDLAATTFAQRRLLHASDESGSEGKCHGRSYGSGNGDLAALLETARSGSGQHLSALAVRVPLQQRWDDLVLPPLTLQRVRQVSAAVRHRRLVYSTWGMERRATSGLGLKVLFAGPSGTGKTMAAAVIAADLGLDLYKIDLSSVVSKYIGETEKNLERIFRAARSSNAILFFDEADAVFGKRSEVKDAHDRYANVELAYLLQRIEDHDGLVVLTTNLARNIDQAFSRRLHFVIEFPLPDAGERLRLWRLMFPPQAPLAADADLEFLAAQFPLAGGDIRNVCLDAAFLAAGNGGRGPIDMRHLVRAAARQLLKQGRVPSPVEFKQYHGLIAEDV